MGGGMSPLLTMRPAGGGAFSCSDLVACSLASLGTKDHDLLAGLLDDDHTQYAKANKTRPSPWVAAADLGRLSLADLGTKDHDLLDGLADDDHSIYALLSGRSGGQSFVGGTGSGEHATLQSTAHASRGYVRAQDDLQLLSNIIRDSGGTNRLQLSTSWPELTVTGGAKITKESAIGGVPPVANTLLKLQSDPVPTTNAFNGLYGAPAVRLPNANAGGSVEGLNYTVILIGGGGGATLPFWRGLTVTLQALLLDATIANMINVYSYPPTFIMGTPAITTFHSFWAPAAASSTIVDAYGAHIEDITLNSGFSRLLEVGPATPYLRVAGGGNPAANVSNVSMKLGAILKLLSEGAAGSGGAGYRCLRVPN